MTHWTERSDSAPAILSCESCRSFTTHEYTGEEKICTGFGRCVGYGQQYRCCACGAVRRWGVNATPAVVVYR